MGLCFCKPQPPPPPPPHYTKKPDPIDPEKAAQVRNFYFSKKVTSSILSSNDTINLEKKIHKRSKSSSKISKNTNSLRGAGSRVDDISEQRDAAQRVLERKRTTQISPEPFQSESTLLSSVIQDITPTVITPSSPTHYSFPTFLFDNQIEASAPPLLPSALILPSAPPPDDSLSSSGNDIVTSSPFIPPPLLLPESSVFAPVGWSPSRLKPEFSTESVYDASGTGAATRRRAEEAEILAEASKREEREAKREALVLRLELIEAQAALAKVLFRTRRHR